MRLFQLFALNLRGQLGEMNARLAVLLKNAQERGDLYTDVAMRTAVGYTRFIVADDPAGGQTDVAEALARWSPRHFNLERMNALMSQVYLDLYAGQGAAAWARLEDAWPQNQGLGPVARGAVARNLRDELRAGGDGGGGETNAPVHWRAVARCAAELERQELPFCHAFARLTRALLAQHRGDGAGAMEGVQRAEAQMAAADLGLFRQAVRHLRGRMMGGDIGRALMDEAEASLHAEGAMVPARIFETCTPGFSP